MTAEDETAALTAREARRCALLMAGDAAGLADLVTDDLTHIHLNGHVDDKAGYIGGVGAKYVFENVARGPLQVRVYGDFAVMVGELSQTIEVRETGQRIPIRAITTQTWIRRGGDWRQNTCHNAPLA